MPVQGEAVGVIFPRVRSASVDNTLDWALASTQKSPVASPQRRIALRNEVRRHTKGAQRPRRAATAGRTALRKHKVPESDFTIS